MIHMIQVLWSESGLIAKHNVPPDVRVPAHMLPTADSEGPSWRAVMAGLPAALRDWLCAVCWEYCPGKPRLRFCRRLPSFLNASSGAAVFLGRPSWAVADMCYVEHQL